MIGSVDICYQSHAMNDTHGMMCEEIINRLRENKYSFAQSVMLFNDIIEKLQDLPL